jgi:hypothetical protein
MRADIIVSERESRDTQRERESMHVNIYCGCNMSMHQVFLIARLQL